MRHKRFDIVEDAEEGSLAPEICSAAGSPFVADKRGNSPRKLAQGDGACSEQWRRPTGRQILDLSTNPSARNLSCTRAARSVLRRMGREQDAQKAERAEGGANPARTSSVGDCGVAKIKLDSVLLSLRTELATRARRRVGKKSTELKD